MSYQLSFYLFIFLSSFSLVPLLFSCSHFLVVTYNELRMAPSCINDLGDDFTITSVIILTITIM